MSKESIQERELTFKRIREQANGDMYEVIKNCNTISKTLGLGNCDLPNIVIAYNNKIIELEKEFTNVGIDFYDRTQCESRFIIENKLQSLIIIGNSFIQEYINTLHVSEEQSKEFIDSWKRPSTFEKLFKKAKFEPKRSILTKEQIERSQILKSNFMNCYDKLYDFTIQDNMVEAILLYKVLTTARGVEDFDSRIDTIDKELQKLGYTNTKQLVKEQMEEQDLTLANVHNLTSVPLTRVKEELER